MHTAKTVASWSGGKDSCLALYKAMKTGCRVQRLLNFISKEYKRCCFHGVEADLLKLQAERIGIPLVQKEVSPDMQKYEEEFKEAVSDLKKEGFGDMIFGDIYLLDHASWVERVCGELGIGPIEPLWNIPALQVVEEFIGSGFKAVVVSCNADVLGREFIGRYIDRAMVDEFVARGVCPCGENGEFHTLVVDGPLFKKRIDIIESEPVLKEGFWRHWFLDIKKYG